MNKTTYRVLCAASFLIPTLGIIADFSLDPLPAELTGLYDKYRLNWPLTAKEIAASVAGVLYLIAEVAALYGMLRFRQWAPKFSIWVTVAGTVIVCFLGPVLMSAFSYSTGSLGSTLFGAALAMAFYSPEVREMFRPGKE